MRLQAYELLMKKLLEQQSTTTVAAKVLPTDPKLAKLLGTSSLGLVARRFFETFLVAHESEDQASRDAEVEGRLVTEIAFRSTARMEMTLEDYETTKGSVAELVELRNTLVHHFLERFDVWSESGCAQAATYLRGCCERIGNELEQLQWWARSMAETRRYAATVFGSDEILDFIFGGDAQSNNADWSTAGIVACLQDALAKNAPLRNANGWTPLSAAIEFATEKYPQETPDKYGCTSWAQVLNDSKRFDIMYARGLGTTKIALFRERRVMRKVSS